MLRPILEIHVAWHPADQTVGDTLMLHLTEHFHGNSYAGLVEGAVEVFARSAGWQAVGEAPRPLPPLNGAAETVLATPLTAVVVCMGKGLARAVQQERSSWTRWLQDMVGAAEANPGRLRVFPARPAVGASPESCLLQQILPMQAIHAFDPLVTSRDLAQALAQWLNEEAGMPIGQRISVFISHTKHDAGGGPGVRRLIEKVRARIDGASHLGSFFDSNALQPGSDWDAHLRSGASQMAMLALRTDLYASRAWCQREMTIAKCHGVPVVVLDAPQHGESRGSFLMDHVPRVPVRAEGDDWREADIDMGLARLVDACLQQAIWRRQTAAYSRGSATEWWAPHAPEPVTLVEWLRSQDTPTDADTPIRIVHPDPPLGPEETVLLERIVHLTGRRGGLELHTPRLLAMQRSWAPLAVGSRQLDGITGRTLALSISDSEDLAALGLLPVHLQLAVAELARMVFLGGARFVYAGDMRPGGHTELLRGELERYAASQGSLTVYLAWSVHRRTPVVALEAFDQALGVHGELQMLDPKGNPLTDWQTSRPAEGVDDVDAETKAAAYESMRQLLCSTEYARIAIAGRRGDGSALPGVLHEVLMSLQYRHPIYLVGGFGGTVLDIAAAIDPSLESIKAPTAAKAGAAACKALNCLRQHAEGSERWAVLANGLDSNENRRLAATHRPSEIAALIMMGLARLADG